MPKVRPLTVALTITFATLVSIGFVSRAGAQRSAIDTYAITNARIVTVSGATLDRGTVVIRNGLIAALDIGTTKVACFIASMGEGDDLHITGFGHHRSRGLRTGQQALVKDQGEDDHQGPQLERGKQSPQ